MWRATRVTDDSEIRVPTRLSMLELGFAPVFYQFVDTIIEVKIAIEDHPAPAEYSRTRSNMQTERTGSHRRKHSFWGTSRSSSNRTQVSTSQV